MVDEKLPFNNFKHIPSRPEIDTVLGMLPALELKRFEEQLDLLDSTISWAFQWYENLEGWGYRASFKQRVLCILHFDRGYFSATLSIPLAMEYTYLALHGAHSEPARALQGLPPLAEDEMGVPACQESCGHGLPPRHHPTEAGRPASENRGR